MVMSLTWILARPISTGILRTRTASPCVRALRDLAVACDTCRCATNDIKAKSMMVGSGRTTVLPSRSLHPTAM